MAEAKGKIAIASCPDKVNFGSVLQSWATERAVSGLGYEALTIDKRGLGAEIRRGRRTYYREHLLDLSLYRAKLGFVGHRVRQKVDREFGRRMAERLAAFRAFEEGRFAYTPRTSTFVELAEAVSGCGTVVVGSDQLWLPVNIAGGYFTLEWVEPPVRRVSYATSFGVSELPGRYMRRTAGFLEGFAAVSVREDTGADLVERARGERPAVVCDPTMLLSAGDYRRGLVDPAYGVPSEPYVFCYFLGKNVWNRECAKGLARETGCRIVAVAHPDEYVAYDDTYADAYPWGAGPAEWVALLAGARYVCTDSFHGSVFSTLFNVPFFTFRRHEGMGSQSTNSRLDTLLSRIGASGRLCETPEAFRDAMARDVDWASINANVAAYRAESRTWLEAALAGKPLETKTGRGVRR